MAPVIIIDTSDPAHKALPGPSLSGRRIFPFCQSSLMSAPMKPTTLEQTEAPDRKRDLSRKLTVIARHLRNRFDQSMTKLGATRSQWTLIAVVASRPGRTQRSIAEILEISEAAADRLIDKLCAEGMLERKARSDDRRAYSVYLTEAAAPYMKALGAIAQRNDEETFFGLSEDQLDQLDALLALVYSNVAAQRETLTKA
jgi:MarR family transcriptional regulator for hemolysin